MWRATRTLSKGVLMSRAPQRFHATAAMPYAAIPAPGGYPSCVCASGTSRGIHSSGAAVIFYLGVEVDVSHCFAGLLRVQEQMSMGTQTAMDIATAPLVGL